MSEPITKAVDLHHRTVEPKILYYGTPVVLLSTLNEDGTTNLAPISSSWALGQCLVIGLGLGGQSLDNLQRHPECVLNLPGPDLWENVERLAPLTGKDPVPDYKQALGFHYEPNKFQASGLTPQPSECVQTQRVAECPLQIEGRVQNIRVPEHTPSFGIVEIEAVRVHAADEIVLGARHIDPQRWSPLLYNFRHYFGLSPELGKSYRSET
jgi:flavin reductase (DIM6/NTAB) family NADH-FMN oxidoreductase RutF